jgi:hypothetical protein
MEQTISENIFHDPLTGRVKRRIGDIPEGFYNGMFVEQRHRVASVDPNMPWKMWSR